MKKLFENILKDNVSGSGEILGKIIETLLRFANESSNVDISKLSLQLNALFDKFHNFAVLFHFINEFENAFKNKNNVPACVLNDFVNNYKKRFLRSQQKAATELINEIDLNGKNILLHSNSSAIKTLFDLLTKQNVKPLVWQTVSSPANEGILQAQHLQKAGFKVHLFHEDAVSLFADKIDLAIFGADMVFDSFFVNKTGTYPLCSVLNDFKKPVFVLAEERKYINENTISNNALKKLVNEEPKPDNEILKENNTNIAVHNYYFEKIPLFLCKKVYK